MLHVAQTSRDRVVVCKQIMEGRRGWQAASAALMMHGEMMTWSYPQAYLEGSPSPQPLPGAIASAGPPTQPTSAPPPPPPGRKSKKGKGSRVASRSGGLGVASLPGELARVVPLASEADLLVEGWSPVQLSKSDRASQATLSADRMSVTSRKGYRMVHSCQPPHSPPPPPQPARHLPATDSSQHLPYLLSVPPTLTPGSPSDMMGCCWNSKSCAALHT